MRGILPVLALAALVTLGGGAADSTCWTTSDPAIDTGDVIPPEAGAPRWYVATYPFCNPGGIVPQCHAETWVYEESNGLPGLQRDDEVHSDVWACRQQGIEVEADAIAA